MTNEELCTQIQNGHDEYIPELWDQVSDFIAWRAHKYLMSSTPEHKQQLKDDMINQSYFHFLKAIETYIHPSVESLSTTLNGASGTPLLRYSRAAGLSV